MVFAPGPKETPRCLVSEATEIPSILMEVKTRLWRPGVAALTVLALPLDAQLTRRETITPRSSSRTSVISAVQAASNDDASRGAPATCSAMSST